MHASVCACMGGGGGDNFNRRPINTPPRPVPSTHLDGILGLQRKGVWVRGDKHDLPHVAVELGQIAHVLAVDVLRAVAVQPGGGSGGGTGAVTGAAGEERHGTASMAGSPVPSRPDIQSTAPQK